MITKVLITGSSGSLGQFVVPHLVEHGYEVIAADTQPSSAINTCHVDFCDFGQTVSIVHTCSGPRRR